MRRISWYRVLLLVIATFLSIEQSLAQAQATLSAEQQKKIEDIVTRTLESSGAAWPAAGSHSGTRPTGSRARSATPWKR